MKCCENCMNNPKNNPLASGFCCCALPAMELNTPRKIMEVTWIPTWTQTTTGTMTKTGNYTFSTTTEKSYADKSSN